METITKRLYYDNGYLKEFKAQVIVCEKTQKGYETILDQTAFYPEGGGQPSDIGTLNGIEVLDVYLKAGIIYHLIKQPIKVGEEVLGKVNFIRRFDLMQQHSGEHIVSGLINQIYGYNNVGFHLSQEYTTCDFDGELSKEQLAEIEIKANEAVYENLEVTTLFYQDTEIKEWEYRSKLDLKGEVRLVTVPGYDKCACCGLHVKRTGEIGSIKIVNAERHRGGVRVTMLCGSRALKDYRQKQDIIAEASRILSAKPDKITSYLEKLKQELESYKQKAALLNEQLFAYKSEEYLKQQTPAITIWDKNLQGDDIRRLCTLLIEKTEKIVLVLGGEEDNFKYALGAHKQDIREINQKLTKEFEGKGGGKSQLCQGNLKGKEEAIVNFLNALIDESK